MKRVGFSYSRLSCRLHGLALEVFNGSLVAAVLIFDLLPMYQSKYLPVSVVSKPLNPTSTICYMTVLSRCLWPKLTSGRLDLDTF